MTHWIWNDDFPPEIYFFTHWAKCVEFPLPTALLVDSQPRRAHYFAKQSKAKYSVLHLWNKWNTLYDKTGLPKKICVAKIFWEKEQPLKSPRRRKAVRIKGRVATQWATLCSTAVCFAPHSPQSFLPLRRAILIVICHCLTSRKTTKKSLIFFLSPT